MRELIEKINNSQQNQQNQQQQTIPTKPYMFQNPYQPQYQYNPQYQEQYQPNYTIFYNCGGRGGRGCGGRGGRGSCGYGFCKHKYCWTHGLCSHNGRECSNPTQGHQADATLENRMGGNTHNVNA